MKTKIYYFLLVFSVVIGVTLYSNAQTTHKKKTKNNQSQSLDDFFSKNVKAQIDSNNISSSKSNISSSSTNKDNSNSKFDLSAYWYYDENSNTFGMKRHYIYKLVVVDYTAVKVKLKSLGEICKEYGYATLYISKDRKIYLDKGSTFWLDKSECEEYLKTSHSDCGY